MLALLVFIFAFFLFTPSLRYGLVDFDDQIYVASHPLVMEGFSAAHVRTALALFPPDATSNQLLLKERLASRLALYEQRRPYREDAFTRMYVAFFGDLTKLRPPEPQ